MNNSNLNIGFWSQSFIEKRYSWQMFIHKLNIVTVKIWFFLNKAFIELLNVLFYNEII